jgi:dUTPase
VIAPVMKVQFHEVSSLDATTRGDGGFGSSGKD